MINSYFTFHPVGQGSFYTGEIFAENWNKRFTMVYDCGSLSNGYHLHNCIYDFSRHLSISVIKFELDLLFLSHLDADHVNGLERILSNCSCGSIYLPYLTPFERLCAVLRNSARDTENSNDYLRFILSPHDYLLNIEKSEIKRIVYIRGNSEKINEENFPQQDKPESSETAFELTDNLDESTEMSPAVLEALEGATLSSKIEVKKANNALYLNNIWEFYIYFEPGTYEQLEALKSGLEKICNWRDGNGVDLSQNDLANILRDKECLAELRKAFKKLFKSHNKTGLVLQHKPINYRRAHLFKNRAVHFIPHYFNSYNFNGNQPQNKVSIINESTSCFWGVSLLTGDIGMNQICNSDYIAKHLKAVNVFQVPHHGSACGWDAGYIANFSLDQSNTSVINFGYGNKYGHPNPNVMHDLKRNLDLQFCNQFEGFLYSIKIDA
jgi:hypothetical protein